MRWVKLFCCLLLLFAIAGTQVGSDDDEEGSMGVRDFPRGLVFFTEEVRKQLPKKTVYYFDWPTEEELRTKLVTRGEAVSRAKASSVKWIKRVLQARWIPKDIENRLIALNDKVKAHDQIRARYMVNNYAIQIIQTTAAVSVLVQPVGKTPVKETRKRQQLVKDAVQAFLSEHEKICKINCSGSIGVRSRYGLLEGRPIKTEIKDAGIYWWGHTHWATDGQTVMFTILKFDGGPAEPSRAGDWF